MSDEVHLEINGVLDLHTFRPCEVKDLIPYYLELCTDKGITELRIIHGKGTGTLRTLVHSILKKSDHVKSFRLAPENAGSWGATLVTLKKQH